MALSPRVTSHLRMKERARRRSIGVTLSGKVPLVLQAQMGLPPLKVVMDPRGIWRLGVPPVCRLSFIPSASASLNLLHSAPQKSLLRRQRTARSAWQLYFTDFIKKAQANTTKKLNVTQAAKEAGREYANLSVAEKEVCSLSNPHFSDI